MATTVDIYNNQNDDNNIDKELTQYLSSKLLPTFYRHM